MEWYEMLTIINFAGIVFAFFSMRCNTSAIGHILDSLKIIGDRVYPDSTQETID